MNAARRGVVVQGGWIVILWVMHLALYTVLADSIYTVKKGDTISGIAQRYGLSARTLADRNGLSRPQHIYPGQKLRIPGSIVSRTTTAPKSANLPTAVQTAINTAKVRSGRWRHIVVHHSAIDTGTVQGMDRYHREVRHMENGLAYHFVIGNGSGMRNGEIAVGHRWKQQLDGGHLATESLNRVAIGICLVGNFDKHPPSPSQMESLRILTRALMKRGSISATNVKTHQQINPVHTRCPGSKFPIKAFANSLSRATL